MILTFSSLLVSARAYSYSPVSVSALKSSLALPSHYPQTLDTAPRLSITANTTFTEWSVICESQAMARTSGRHRDSVFREEVLRHAGEARLANLAFLLQSHSLYLDAHRRDKGNSSALATLEELLRLGGDFEVALQVFRRNIALRANRVLHPARNAQILSAVINSLIAFDDWTVAERVADYVGLTSSTYLRQGPRGPLVDVSAMGVYLARRMLELDLDRLAWERDGRVGPEPSTPRSRGESVQEWLYTQVLRSDLGPRCCDLLLATSRLALRQALLLPGDDIPAAVHFSFLGEGRLSLKRAGIPVDDDFTERWRTTLLMDHRMLQTTSEISFES